MTSASAARTDEPLAGSEGGACDEAQLIRDAVAGDSGEFDQLVHRHHRRVFTILWPMTRHRLDAQDISEHTFIKAYTRHARFAQARPTLNGQPSIARNAAINHFRDTKKWEEMPFETAGSEPTPAHSLERKEETANLWTRARELLSRREFEVLWLRFAEEMSTRDTARVVGLTETHVKVLIFRARRALMKGAVTQ